MAGDGIVYLIVETHLTFEEQITKKAKSETFLVREDELEQSAVDFLRSFMPEDNKVESLIQRMDQEKGQKQSFMYELEIKVSQITEQKMLIQKEFSDLIKNTESLDKVQNHQILKENLEIRERNH